MFFSFVYKGRSRTLKIVNLKSYPDRPGAAIAGRTGKIEVHFFPLGDFPAETGRPGVSFDRRFDMDWVAPTSLGKMCDYLDQIGVWSPWSLAY